MTSKVAIIGSDPANEQVAESLRSGKVEVVFYDDLKGISVFPNTVAPDCVLLFDPFAPSSVSTLRGQFPLAQLVVVVRAEEAALAMAAKKVPGTEVFCRPYDPVALLAHIRLFAPTSKARVRKGDAANDLQSRFARLSAREFQVLELVVQGLSSKQIATALEISVRTVDAHRATILRKTRTRNAIELLQLHAAFQALSSRKST